MLKPPMCPLDVEHGNPLKVGIPSRKFPLTQTHLVITNGRLQQKQAKKIGYRILEKCVIL